jgi:uncharacterized protein GlcG (DUF336 family)
LIRTQKSLRHLNVSPVRAFARRDPAKERQGDHETAVVLDADGQIIVALRGDGAGIHTLDSAHDKAYTAVSFKNDTLALAGRAKGENSIAGSLSCRMSCSLLGVSSSSSTMRLSARLAPSGAPGGNLDDNCAKAGLEKIRARLK